MTPLERSWAAALCASGDAVANMGTDALRLVATKKPQDVTSAGIMESTHKLARACRIADATTTSTPAAQKAADAYALEAALYAVAYEAARLVRSDMWRLVAMRLDEAQEVGTRTSDLHPPATGQADYAPPPAGRARIDRPEPCGRAAVRRGKARQAAAGLGKRAGSRCGLRLHDGCRAELPAQMGEPRWKMKNL